MKLAGDGGEAQLTNRISTPQSSLILQLCQALGRAQLGTQVTKWDALHTQVPHTSPDKTPPALGSPSQRLKE